PRWSERRDGDSAHGSNAHRRAPSGPRAPRSEPYATPEGPSDATRELARQRPADPREAAAGWPGPRGAAPVPPGPMRGDQVSPRPDNTATDAQGIRPVGRIRQP